MKVSTCIITYNQESYIKECLDGAINQQLNCDYEIIIGDDCSNDNTSVICENYAKKYPDIIKYFKRKENLGMMGNWIETIKNCSGIYIALCEGDDYWTDPYKLQKQVDFLEENAKYVLVCNIIKVINTYDKSFKLKNEFHTSGLLFRNVISREFIEFDYQNNPIFNLDTFLILYLLEFGDRKILEFIGSCYRIGQQGVYSSKSTLERRELMLLSYHSSKKFFQVNKMKKSLKELKKYILDFDLSEIKRIGKFDFKILTVFLKLLLIGDVKRIKGLFHFVIFK